MKKELKATNMVRCLAAERLAKLANSTTEQPTQPTGTAPAGEAKRPTYRPGQNLVPQTA